MTDLSPESKALIDLARGDDEPNAVDRARVRRALGASLATGLAVSSATSVAAGATAKAAGATAGLAGSLKIAMWVGVGMAFGALTTTTALVALRGPAAEPTSVARPAPREASPAVIKAEPPVQESPASEPTDTTTIPLEVTSKPTTLRAPQPSPSSLAAEMRLLETARAALSGGDARRALTLIQEHEREFPAGSLSEERRASKVFALCELGRRAEAARAAAEFLRTAPASPLRGRVLDSCAFPE
jgi:hypothetical protein